MYIKAVLYTLIWTYKHAIFKALHVVHWGVLVLCNTGPVLALSFPLHLLKTKWNRKHCLTSRLEEMTLKAMLWMVTSYTMLLFFLFSSPELTFYILSNMLQGFWLSGSQQHLSKQFIRTVKSHLPAGRRQEWSLRAGLGLCNFWRADKLAQERITLTVRPHL